MERDEDDFLEEEEDEMQDGMIDRQKGRRLISGCSTVILEFDVFYTE